MANSAFHNRNTCHQEDAHHRQIRTHQSCQPANRHNHRIEIPKIPSPQSRRLQGQSQPQPSAQHQRRPVRTCCRVLINAGRLRHYPITPQIPVNQVSATPLNSAKSGLAYFKSGLNGSKRFISAFAFAICAGVADGICDHRCHNSNESGYNFDASVRICIARSSSLFSVIICAA